MFDFHRLFLLSIFSDPYKLQLKCWCLCHQPVCVCSLPAVRVIRAPMGTKATRTASLSWASPVTWESITLWTLGGAECLKSYTSPPLQCQFNKLIQLSVHHRWTPVTSCLSPSPPLVVDSWIGKACGEQPRLDDRLGRCPSGRTWI